ncbi:MAG: DUF4965 domain-containing protein [Eubacteriales bacterium]
MRAPAYPLITVDPYFSVWSMDDSLCGNNTSHWTGKPNTILGTVRVDGESYTFMGIKDGQKCLRQTDVKLTALSTIYTFEGAGIRLSARFTTPLLLDDLKLTSRPVSYLELSAVSTDGAVHKIEVEVAVSEEICLDKKGQHTVTTRVTDIDGHPVAVMGSSEQSILSRSGDDLRIDWGYFYLSVQSGTVTVEKSEMTYLKAQSSLGDGVPALFTFAYDDEYSIQYFNKYLKSLWNSDGTTIRQVIASAFSEYRDISSRCEAFDAQLQADAYESGGRDYAEILNLTYRQAIAAHKMAVDEEGEILWISKECFSNGCAATVDVTYPSIPLFLLYNTELVKGMLRPVFKFAQSEGWIFPFAPHDVGQYPLLNGQVYGANSLEYQMPVEECGNMLLTVAAITAVDKNASFAQKYMTTLEQWLDYLMQKGLDPENQLCTDDFAGHLAHNCNLSLKAICAIAAFSRVYDALGQSDKSIKCLETARQMAGEWIRMADNGDGSFRLAFNSPGSFSLKYNMVWDKVMNLGIFPSYVMNSELASYRRRTRPYGIPLDNRADYTKSDWLVWTATMAAEDEYFQSIIHLLWLTYNHSVSRVPSTDWYSTVTSMQCGFQNRTVQGGLFMKLLDYKGYCR